jgi:hypothetical protein
MTAQNMIVLRTNRLILAFGGRRPGSYPGNFDVLFQSEGNGEEEICQD